MSYQSQAYVLQQAERLIMRQYRAWDAANLLCDCGEFATTEELVQALRDLFKHTTGTLRLELQQEQTARAPGTRKADAPKAHRLEVNVRCGPESSTTVPAPMAIPEAPKTVTGTQDAAMAVALARLQWENEQLRRDLNEYLEDGDDEEEEEPVDDDDGEGNQEEQRLFGMSGEQTHQLLNKWTDNLVGLLKPGQAIQGTKDAAKGTDPAAPNDIEQKLLEAMRNFYKVAPEDAQAVAMDLMKNFGDEATAKATVAKAQAEAEPQPQTDGTE